MELTKKDVIGMLTMMKCNYPYAYKDQTEQETAVLVNTWFTILCKYPKEVIQTAFYKCLEVCKMPPTIADLMEQINKFQDAIEPTDNELWAELVRAVNDTREVTYFGYQSHWRNGEIVYPKLLLEKIFNDLDPVIKEYVNSPAGLKNIADLDTLDYEKARFLKTYPIIKQRQRTRNEINPDILKLAGVQDMRLLEQGSEYETN